MLIVSKPVLVYDRNMQMHLFANLPHCVTNLHSNFLSGISIFQILYLILASFKGLSSFLHVSNIPRTETTKKNRAASFLYKFDLGMGRTWEKFSSLPAKKPQKFETATGKENF